MELGLWEQERPIKNILPSSSWEIESVGIVGADVKEGINLEIIHEKN